MTPPKNRATGQTVALVLVVILAIGSGLVHGWLDGRWSSGPDLASIGERLNKLPEALGDWVLLRHQEMPANALQMLRCYGHTLRVYQHSKTGAQVTIAVLLGPRGPIAVHTPEICYSGQGVKQAKERQSVPIKANGLAHSVWQLNFLSKSDSSPALEVFYAWSDGGAWQASKYPRFWLTSRLYKFQLAGPPPASGEQSACVDFLQNFLPALSNLTVKTQTA